MTQKTRMSTSAYVLIALLIVIAIALPILHVVGVIDLSFIGETFMGVMEWAATDAINGVLLIGGTLITGMLTWYTLQKYIIGTKIRTVTVGGYQPTGQNISNPQPQDDVVVSE